MSFVSNKFCIDTSALFQEAQFQANTIEEIILYVKNVQKMELISSWEEDYQVNPDNFLEDNNESIYFFRFQSNLIVYILDKLIVKATLQPLNFCLELLQYILSNDTKNVERVESPIISIPKKDPFWFLRGGKPDNTVLPMKHTNLFDTDHPVREYHDEYSTSGDKNNNTVRNTAAATTTPKIIPLDEAIL